MDVKLSVLQYSIYAACGVSQTSNIIYQKRGIAFLFEKVVNSLKYKVFRKEKEKREMGFHLVKSGINDKGRYFKVFNIPVMNKIWLQNKTILKVCGIPVAKVVYDYYEKRKYFFGLRIKREPNIKYIEEQLNLYTSSMANAFYMFGRRLDEAKANNNFEETAKSVKNYIDDRINNMHSFQLLKDVENGKMKLTDELEEVKKMMLKQKEWCEKYEFEAMAEIHKDGKYAIVKKGILTKYLSPEHSYVTFGKIKFIEKRKAGDVQGWFLLRIPLVKCKRDASYIKKYVLGIRVSKNINYQVVKSEIDRSFESVNSVIDNILVSNDQIESDSSYGSYFDCKSLIRQLDYLNLEGK